MFETSINLYDYATKCDVDLVKKCDMRGKHDKILRARLVAIISDWNHKIQLRFHVQRVYCHGIRNSISIGITANVYGVRSIHVPNPIIVVKRTLIIISLDQRTSIC